MSLGKRYKFFGTTFQVVTGYGTPVTSGITAISKANPCVVTDTAHGLTTGAVVKITAVVGMTELNDGLYVVETLTADTFALVGVDSTNYDTYVSGGTYTPATFGASCEVTNYQGDSGSTTETETETNCGKAIDFGSPDPGSVTMAYNRAPNAFQTAIESARKTVTPIAIKTTIPNSGGTMIDVGVITQVTRGAQSGGTWAGGCTLRRTVDRVDLA